MDYKTLWEDLYNILFDMLDQAKSQEEHNAINKIMDEMIELSGDEEN